MSGASHIHEQIVIDSDVHFTIDTVTRTISNKNADKVNKKLVLTQYDNKSERYSFDIDRKIDNHDLTLCNKIQIHFINVGSNKQKNIGVYLVDDAHINESDENKISFSWLISQNATKLSGYLSFLVSFECVDGDTILYRWSTTTYDAIQIVVGLDNSNAIVEQYVDELLAWENSMKNELSTWQANMEFEYIPNLVDERYIDREFATSEEVGYIFEIYDPVNDSRIVVDDIPTEDSENLVRSGGVKSYTDTVISNSATEVKSYTDGELNKKVDKVDGKGLSTEDYTTEEKTKLAGLENYIDAELRTAIETKAEASEVASLSSDLSNVKKQYLKTAYTSEDGTILYITNQEGTPVVFEGGGKITLWRYTE